jgi:hypothetical protein
LKTPTLAPVGLTVGIAALVAVLGPRYGFLRAFVGVAAGTLFVVAGLRYLQVVVSTPAQPEVADVSEYGLKYVCTMCGLELKVEKAARDKPPTHCMEPMVLVRTGGKPPLRPL